MKSKILLALVLFLGGKSFACLNDTSILPDGRWSYEGVSLNHQSAGNETQIIAISTDPHTGKRYLELEGVWDFYQGGYVKREITQCSPVFQLDSTYRYTASSQKLDAVNDIYEIFSASIEVQNGAVVLSPSTNECLYRRTQYYQYSKKGMSPGNADDGGCFRPGYHINEPPRYDGNGSLVLQWYGTQPVRLKSL